MPLRDVTLADDTPPCTSPTFVGGDTDGDDELDLTETWTYTCTRRPTDTVDQHRDRGRAPRPSVTPPGPPVTDTDTATVNAIDPDLTLTKSVDQHLVFPGTTVHLHLRRREHRHGRPAQPGRPGRVAEDPAGHWVTDDKCADVTYVSGDNDDGLLNPGEAWRFTCSTAICAPTTNTATIHAVTVARRRSTLVRTAIAFVDVATADIAITKTALRRRRPRPRGQPRRRTGRADPAPGRVRLRGHQHGLAAARERGRPGHRRQVLAASPGWRAPTSTATTCSTRTRCGTSPAPPRWSKADGFPSDGSVSSLVTNTATATGTPLLTAAHPRPDVSDSDTAQVLVIKPSLTLTKTRLGGPGPARRRR